MCWRCKARAAFVVAVYFAALLSGMFAIGTALDGAQWWAAAVLSFVCVCWAESLLARWFPDVSAALNPFQAFERG